MNANMTTVLVVAAGALVVRYLVVNYTATARYF
jgi:hypothetical protein